MIIPDRTTEQYGKVTCCKCGKDATHVGHWWNTETGKSTCFKCRPKPKELGGTMSYNDYENGKLDGYNEGYSDGYEHGQKDCKEDQTRAAKETELYNRISSIEDTLSRVVLMLNR